MFLGQDLLERDGGYLKQQLTLLLQAASVENPQLFWTSEKLKPQFPGFQIDIDSFEIWTNAFALIFFSIQSPQGNMPA